MVRTDILKKNIVLLLTAILIFPAMAGAHASLCHELTKVSNSGNYNETMLDQHVLHQHGFQHKTPDNGLDMSSSTFFTDHISNYCVNVLCVLPSLSNIPSDKYIQEAPGIHSSILVSIHINIRKRPPKIALI